MKSLLLPLLVIALATGLRADIREFTNTKGQTLKAEVLKADPTEILLRLEGGRTATVPLNTLIESDKIYVTKWLANQLPDLEITPDFFRGLNKDRQREESIRQTFKMTVEVQNFSPNTDLEECQVTYFLIGRSIANDNRYKVMSRQIRDLTVPHGKTRKVTFEDVNNRYQESTSRNHGNASGRDHRGLGYLLQIVRKRDRRTVHLSSSTALFEKAKNEIVDLAEEDEVDETFIKEKEKVVKKEPDKEKKTPVITIR